MQFRAEEYYQASIERMRQSAEIYQSGRSHALAMYCAGLAVECLLRAFRWTEDASFEGRHDLSELFKESKLLRIDDNVMRLAGASEDEIDASARRLRAASVVVVRLWRNNLRFASEASLKAFLRRTGQLKGTKGDPLKKNAKDLIDAAQTIVNRGVTLWTLQKKS